MSLDLGAPATTWAPKWYTARRYDRTDGVHVVDFAESVMSISKGIAAGELFTMTPWQRWLTEGVLERRPDGRLRYRRVLIGLARKNGKSLFGSALGLNKLYDPDLGDEVYSVAGDRAQARIVFDEAAWQVENNEALRRHGRYYRSGSTISVPSTGSTWRVLSRDSRLAQGFNPSLVVFDEFHVQADDRLWDAMTLGSGARVDPLVIAITTAGDAYDSPCGRLYDYGIKVATGEIDDPAFGFYWWEADEDDDPSQYDTWAKANPNLREGLLDPEDLATAQRQTSPVAFARFRLNRWAAGAGAAWIAPSTWNALARPRPVPPRTPITIGFDGSVSDDATALIASTLDGHIFVLGVWENLTNDPDWMVNRDEVEMAVHRAFETYDVRRMGCDPAYWQVELRRWVERYGARTVVEWRPNNAMAAPAAEQLYADVANGALTHAGDAVLTRHVTNAIAKVTASGTTITKDRHHSHRKIDAAMAAVIANDLRHRVPASPPRTFGF